MASCAQRCQRALGLLLYMAAFGLSGFALYVKYQKDQDPDYKAACDIQEGVMCSTVMQTEYSKGFGLVEKITGSKDHPLNIPNTVYGLLMYGSLGLAFVVGPHNRLLVALQFYCILAANLMSVYLFYVLQFVLKNICVICYSLYVVNILLLLNLYCIRKGLLARSEPTSSSAGRWNDQRGQPYGLLPSSSDFKKRI